MVTPSERVEIWVCLFLRAWSLHCSEGAHLGALDLCHFGPVKWGGASLGVFGACLQDSGLTAWKVASETELRSGHSTVGGPSWTKMGLVRLTWTILVHLGLANPKIQFGIRSCSQLQSITQKGVHTDLLTAR